MAIRLPNWTLFSVHQLCKGLGSTWQAKRIYATVVKIKYYLKGPGTILKSESSKHPST